MTTSSPESKPSHGSPRAPLADASTLLVAIVESSDDAILSKDLNGIITSWNAGARRLFGYTAEEAIGRSITMLIPPDRPDEEPGILARIRRGERIDHFETVRLRKDGTPIDISITVSPIRNARGEIVGASKIARDIGERRRSQEQLTMLLREMNHRIKNLFTLAGSLVTLSARSAGSAQELARDVGSRLAALADAHALTMSGMDAGLAHGTTLHALLGTILAPYQGEHDRLRITGPDVELGATATTHLALLLHELTTNSAKYGALSVASGWIEVSLGEDDTTYGIEWREHAGPPVTAPASEGFGSVIGRATALQLGGEIRRDWQSEGMVATIVLAKDLVRR